MEKLLEVLKALSDETRLKILTLLLTHDFCVRALAERVGLSEAAVSQHLQILRLAGLVKGEKRGYFTHYSVDRNLLKDTADNLIELSQTPSFHRENCPQKPSNLLTEDL
jgi:DNA-binding transcriptional ArsR family regulator